MSGTLYIVSTPIGNLKDITLRALDILRQSDYIIAESSARTSKLLNEYQIRQKIITFNKDNEKKKLSLILKDLKDGATVSLVSDAGTPVISDPGFEIIKNYDSINIIPIPGPSSLTAAVSISKIPMNNFMFLGFLSKKSKERRGQLQYIQFCYLPTIIFESKHRINSLVKEVIDILGPEANISIMRELTKMHEEVLFGTAEKLLSKLRVNPIAGEITMIINPVKPNNQKFHIFDSQIIELSKKYSIGEVVNIIRLFNDLNKKELYKYVLSIRQKS